MNPPNTAAPLILAELTALAAGPRVARHLEVWVDPEVALVRLFAESPYAAWLDAGPDAVTGWSYLGTLGAGGVAVVASADSGAVILQPSTGRSEVVDASALDVLGTIPTTRRASTRNPQFEVGWIGWIGYESGAAASRVPVAIDDGPDSALLFIDQAIAFDHRRRRIVLHHFADTPSSTAWSSETEAILRRLAVTPDVAGPAAPSTASIARIRHAPQEYRSRIVRCLDRISEGDAYQLCLTNQISIDSDDDPLTVFRRLRRINPSPRGGLVVVGNHAIASSSPEQFLSVAASGLATTSPIKGTRPRGRTPADDDRLRLELARDDKERAENVMIVDLMRNDLSRVSEVGTVAVTRLFAVEAYSSVFQLVSTVEGQLNSTASLLDVLRSTFPAGSMTGAPKARAMSILNEIEDGPRGAYAGIFGIVSLSNEVDLSMTIRTAVFDRSRHRVTVGTGGGITALSDPDAEVAEMLMKAEPLLRALGATLAPVSRDRDGSAAPHQ